VLNIPHQRIPVFRTISWMFWIGSAESKPLVDHYRQKLGSSEPVDQQFASQPLRKTPKYLRIIATADDPPERCFKAESKGDVGVLRWELVKPYFGSAQPRRPP
jgi:hypothetical protein